MPLEQWIDDLGAPKPHEEIKNESDEDIKNAKNYVNGLIKENKKIAT